MINPQDGSIQFDSPKIHFSRGMTLEQFRASSLFPLFTLSQDLDPCFTYNFGPVRGDGLTFDGAVWFYSGVILKLSLRIIEPARPDGDEDFHRNHLREIFGYQAEGEFGSLDYKFAWGEIVIAEIKGAESDIWIHYIAV
jgi:hypothetical protein